jgi:hypothetical protein
LAPRLPGIIGDKHQLLPLTKKLRININTVAFKKRNSKGRKKWWNKPNEKYQIYKDQAI